MLSKKHRFHGHGSLRYLYKNGKTARNRVLMVRWVENKQRDNGRFTVIVGKKVVKSAVKRNRIRRRIYEYLRVNLDSVAPKHDIAFTVFSADFLTIPYDQLEKNMKEVLKMARLYHHIS